MDANFLASLSHVLKHEGGYVNHPSDPGGATNKGITIANFRRYVNPKGTVADLKAITDAQVARVYRKHYWDAVKGDDLPAGIDYAVFDFGVNSGPSRAIKFLQKVLGVAQDGKLGPITLEAARRADAAAVIDQLCGDRLAWLKRLKHWPTFGRGWTARVSAVETEALAMARKPLPVRVHPIPAPVQPKPVNPAPEPAVGFWQWLINLILGRK